MSVSLSSGATPQRPPLLGSCWSNLASAPGCVMTSASGPEVITVLALS